MRSIDELNQSVDREIARQHRLALIERAERMVALGVVVALLFAFGCAASVFAYHLIEVW